MADDQAITAFIEAHLAEDAAIAQAAADAGAEPTWEADRGQVLTGGLNAPVWLMDSLSAGDAPLVHAARHDPARVLREVEVKRRILTEHKQVPAEPASHTGCSTCHYDGDCDVVAPQGLCDTVRWLAHPYADHPDYNPAWRVA